MNFIMESIWQLWVTVAILGILWRLDYFKPVLAKLLPRKEIVIEDIGYCPCRLSSVGACGETETYGDVEECGVDVHLATCKSEGCNGLGDLIDQSEV